MKVLLVNGSPRKNGNTFVALTEVSRTLETEGIETEIVQIGNKPVRGTMLSPKLPAGRASQLF